MKRTRLAGAAILAAAVFALIGIVSGQKAAAADYYVVEGGTVVYGTPVVTPPVKIYPNGKRDYNPYSYRKYKDDLPGLVDAINRDYPPFRNR